MFESAEVGNAVSKDEYAKAEPHVREALLDAQHALAGSDQSCVLIVGGVEGAGKSEVVNLLLSWMDARGIQVHTLFEPTCEEAEHPDAWRFWRALPATGRIAMLLGSWYSQPIIDHALGKSDDAELDQALDRIVELERMLTRENVIVLKLWLHLSKKGQKKRFRQLSEDPRTAWRVSKREKRFARNYDDFRDTSERALRRTDLPFAPWHIIECTDPRFRDLTVTRTVQEVLEQKIAAAAQAKAEREKERGKKSAAASAKPPKTNLLNQLDLTQSLDKKEYEQRLGRLQGKLFQQTLRLHKRGKSAIILFEGADAAGKGGAIRRLTAGMDARLYQVKSVAAPTDEERAHPYLWRFWRALPRCGHVTIYDRSWYGRVLVERIEGFATTDEWQRAYAEINDFEEQLVEDGIVLCKFWLAISPDEQLRRFKERQETPYKQYKITREDWRNRAKWDAYEAAACDMFEKTSVEHAPWTLVAANDKHHARIHVLRTVVGALEEALD